MGAEGGEGGGAETEATTRRRKNGETGKRSHHLRAGPGLGRQAPQVPAEAQRHSARLGNDRIRLRARQSRALPGGDRRTRSAPGPNTPRALNYRGYATRKLGRTDEGISYYLKSVALDPAYPQVREYLGEAYVIEGKFDLAKDQLATIEKLCGKECEYYQDLSEALEQAHAL